MDSMDPRLDLGTGIGETEYSYMDPALPCDILMGQYSFNYKL